MGYWRATGELLEAMAYVGLEESVRGLDGVTIKVLVRACGFYILLSSCTIQGC